MSQANSWSDARIGMIGVTWAYFNKKVNKVLMQRIDEHFCKHIQIMKKRCVKYVHSDYLLQHADMNPAVKQRASLVHELITSYGLLNHVEILQPKLCSPTDLARFHSRDYLQQFEECTQSTDTCSLSYSNAESDVELDGAFSDFGLGFDCPIWPRLLDYVCIIAGATITACHALCKSAAPAKEVIINLTGGWHHAQRDKAGGYCYVNDIVLGMLILGKRFKRILYIDLDVHHGDGVEAAFEVTKRVFTLSFHQYECGFYPCTGAATDCGFGGAKGYAANFPYRAGISGEAFKQYFKRITQEILRLYAPDALMIQCGADAIVGDPLGGTNLTPEDLIECISFVMRQCNLPTILLGGGGYHFSNTSRYWTSLVASVCGLRLTDDIPDETPHFLSYGPDYSLSIAAKSIKDFNTIESLENCAMSIESTESQV